LPLERVCKQLFTQRKNMEKTVEKLIQILRERAWHITFAESCTGGGIASAFTAVAGASAVFSGSFVTYSEESKTSMVGVKPDTIAAHTVYSEAVAREMAEGAAKALGAEVAVSVTGIAGPGGALPGIPVGTVCFGYTICGETTTEEKHFEGLTREGVRAAAIHHALARVLAFLCN
jgi:nicotinamide-nucleotide amidase